MYVTLRAMMCALEWVSRRKLWQRVQLSFSCSFFGSSWNESLADCMWFAFWCFYLFMAFQQTDRYTIYKPLPLRQVMGFLSRLASRSNSGWVASSGKKGGVWHAYPFGKSITICYRMGSLHVYINYIWIATLSICNTWWGILLTIF